MGLTIDKFFLLSLPPLHTREIKLEMNIQISPVWFYTLTYHTSIKSCCFLRKFLRLSTELIVPSFIIILWHFCPLGQEKVFVLTRRQCKAGFDINNKPLESANWRENIHYARSFPFGQDFWLKITKHFRVCQMETEAFSMI